MNIFLLGCLETRNPPILLFSSSPPNSILTERELKTLKLLRIETMAFAHYRLAVPVESSNHPKISVLNSSFSHSHSHSHSLCFASSHRSKSPNLSNLPTFRKIGHKGNFRISHFCCLYFTLLNFLPIFYVLQKLLGF